MNPIRYRGYYYDTETGYYYLQSRYYNPEWGRFLNADALFIAGDGIIRTNMFVYCGNNPVNMIDPSGTNDVSGLYGFMQFVNRLAEFINKLFSVLKSLNISKTNNIDIVARTIYGEEHGRTQYPDWKAGQTAVAVVIQNRYNKQSSEFGLTFKEICTTGQFDGYSSAKNLSESEMDSEAWEHAYALAVKVVNGQTITPPSGITSSHLFFNLTSTYNDNVNRNGGKFSFGPGTTLVTPRGVVTYGGNTFFYH
jgi:RHS repeat-associated protein